MAYRKSVGRRAPARRPSRSYGVGRRATGGRRSSRSGGARKRAPAGRQQTLKIVIEQVGVSPVARPDGPMQTEKKGTKARF